MLERVRGTATFRKCPVCGSDAVSQLATREAGAQDATVEVRCGECATWRTRTLQWTRALALEHRLKRMARRHRREIEDDLRRVRLAGLASGDFLHGPGITTPLP